MKTQGSTAASAVPGADPGAALDAEPGAPPVFDVVITPNQALGAKGLLTVIGIITALLVVSELALAGAGLWISCVLLLCNAVFLVAAFLACRWDLRRAERVLVAHGTISVERFDGRRRFCQCGSFPLFGLRLERHLDPEYGCQALYLLHQGTRLEIARDLAPTERTSFFLALHGALAETGTAPALITRTAPALFGTPDEDPLS
jgi:uncharacterized membrane protein